MNNIPSVKQQLFDICQHGFLMELQALYLAQCPVETLQVAMFLAMCHERKEMVEYIMEQKSLHEKGLQKHLSLFKQVVAGGPPDKLVVFQAIWQDSGAFSEENARKCLDCVAATNAAEFVEDLLPMIKFNKHTDSTLERAFITTCEKGYKELAQHFLDFAKTLGFASVQKMKKEAFKRSCYTGQDHIIEFLLLEDEMKVSKSLLSWIKNDYQPTSTLFVDKDKLLATIESRDFFNTLDNALAPAQAVRKKSTKI